MSSKKTKSTKESKGSKKSPGKKSYQHELVTPDCWINELAVIDINDNSWTCSVTIIEEESTDSSVYMEHFNEATINGNRLSVKGISKLEVIRYVVKNMAESHPGESLTPVKLLCSEIFKLVGPEFQNKIPTQLLASLVKYLILEYKDLNNTIRDSIEKRKQEFEEYQQSLWQTPVKSISSKGTKSSMLENKSNKSNKATKTKANEKPFTKLRKRGEEWKDKTWMDDSPHDGPQLYIAISTFYDPDLPLELLQLNIPLHAITKLSLWETSSSTKSPLTSVPTDLKKIVHSLIDFRHKSTPHLNSTKRKRIGKENDQTENYKTSIFSFWETIEKLKTEFPTALMFKNVMFLTFTPEHLSFQYQIKSFQEEIYKQISYFLYNIHEISKQHTQYLSEIQLKNVHSAETFDLSNMKIYQSLLDSVPHEIVNIPFLLDAIVIQVCDLENDSGQKVLSQELEKSNEKSIQVASNNLTELFTELNLKYDLFNELFNYTVSKEDKSKRNNTDSCSIKHVLKHFDEKNIKTFHLQEDIANFVRNRIAHILKIAWNNMLAKLFSISCNDGNIVKLCSEVVKIAEETNENILNYYIYILTVNSILNSVLIHDFSSSTFKINTFKESVLYERENMCKDCTLEVHNEIFSMASFLKNTLSNLSNSVTSKISTYKLSDEIIESNVSHIEYMTTDVMLQWIQRVWYSFNKFETSYCPFTNQVVIVLHNLLGSKIFEEKWVGKLTTHVPIRDFVEYILEEEKDWLSLFNSKSTAESSKQDKAVTFCIEKPVPDDLPFLFPEHQFISYRSLKYETILKQQKSEKQLKIPSPENSKSPKIKTGSKQSDSSKKTKRSDKKKEKLSDNKLVSVDSNKEETPKENHTFIGYDLGDPMRFQFSGLKKEKIIDNCCRITLQAMEKLYGEKSQALTVTISDHSLYYMYKPYSESTLINPFHLILSSGIVLYFGLSNKEINETGIFDQIPKTFKSNSSGLKQASLLINNSVLETEYLTHQTVNPTLGENTQFLGSSDLTPNLRNYSSCFPHTLKGVPYFEIPLILDLKISLPNGLYIELARDSNLFYVRQTLLSRGMLAKSIEKEKFRCYLSNGCMVKFLLNDTLEILSPDGMHFTVFEIKDKLLLSEKDEAKELNNDETTLKPTLSNISVRKNKRTSEVSSKSSKVKTDKKKDKILTDPTTTFINTENTHAREMDKNLNTSILNFECTTSNGKRFTVKNNKVTVVLADLLITHSTNVAENCIDIERTDGVTTKHLADGSLLVQFTDGSRITSTPLEAGEVFCEWSSKELNQWFSDSPESLVVAPDLKAESSLSKQSKISYVESCLTSSTKEKTSANLESVYKAEVVQSDILKNEIEKELKMSELEEINIKPDSETVVSKQSAGTLLTSVSDRYTLKKPFYHEDGFVVYYISYLMEHPNYGSVCYNAKSCDVELTLPLNTKITIKNDGCYEAHFDKAHLTVDNDEIYFGKISESGDFERTVIINNSATNNKNAVNFSNYFNRLNSLPQSVDEFCQSTGIKSLLRGMITKTEVKCGLLLYCVDAKINEIIVDYDFNIYELHGSKDKYLTPGIGNSFTSIVINDDLSGFRLVTDEEVKSHIQLMSEMHGLLHETENEWKSVLTTVPAITNESEKWLMNYQKNLTEKTRRLIKSSTYGKRESWLQPFVEKEEKVHNLVGYKAVVVRLLHEVPIKENILEKLKVAVKNYNKKSIKNLNTRIFLDEARVDFLSLDELIRNPELLCKLITDENTKKNIEEDQFRRNMKHNFLRSLINKAVIKSRKIRKRNIEKKLKSSLRMREIPPYHLSGFGYVHSILDEVIENATGVCIRRSASSSSEKVNYIIDELLSLVSKTKLCSTGDELDSDTITKVTDNIEIKSLVSGILTNVCALIHDRNHQIYINDILEKPLKLVTSDDIEFMSKLFGSGDCPILHDEEFILQDVLDAGLQLSNYFENLRSMLEFYRGINPTQIS